MSNQQNDKYNDYLSEYSVNNPKVIKANAELCECDHPLSDHNNADSCSKYLECGCKCFEPKESDA